MKLIGNLKRKVLFLLLISLTSSLLTSCSNLKFEGNVSGDDSSARNDIGFVYHINDRVKVKNKISQPYSYEHNIDKIFPDYGETSLSFEF